MNKFVAIFIGVVLALLGASPALAASFSLSPAEVQFDVPADGSRTLTFLVYDYAGDFDISLEDIPLRVEPQKVSVTASSEGTPVELTFYGDSSLGPQVFQGTIVFLAGSGGNIAFGVKVIATVNQVAADEPPPETTPAPPEAVPSTPSLTSPEAIPDTPSVDSKTLSSPSIGGFPIGGIVGIAAAITVVSVVLFTRRKRY